MIYLVQVNFEADLQNHGLKNLKCNDIHRSNSNLKGPQQVEAGR